MEDLLLKKGESVTVLTTKPINGGFLDYMVPNDNMHVLDFVEVPLGSSSCIGVIWLKSSKNFDKKKLKNITRSLELTPMSVEMRNFLIQLASYTINPLNKVLKLALGAQDFLKPLKRVKYYYIGKLFLEKPTVKRNKVIEFLKIDPDRKFSMLDLTTKLGASSSLINNLISSDNIRVDSKIEFLSYDISEPRFSDTLSKSQKVVSNQLRNQMRAKQYSTTLLRGVTGSGKTEVYLDAISEAFLLGKQVLVLVPEIALSIDFVRRVTERFDVVPGEWHSGILLSERRRLYHAVAKNQLNLVIGARSALFLPFKNLGLIVVDEEHDGSYKQEEGVCYNARDMAVMRASLSGAQVILASATPSLETWVNAKNGKYRRIDLDERYGSAILPDIEVIDLKTQNMKPGNWISTKLKEEITKRLGAGEQSLLFLNRRGYAPITLCKSCGFQIGCKHCDARLVQHRYKNMLICHQCGDSASVPTACPNCLIEGKLKAIGPGIERLEEECSSLFPDSKIGVLSSDNVESISELQKRIEKFTSGDVDIIIGTQLVSKGHNFPNITLVGVIDADLGLQGSDLRAAEKTFQSLRQVSGRAGRHKKVGKALLQTYSPEHPVILAIVRGDDDIFWAVEAAARKSAKSPPFGKMVALILSGVDEKELFGIAHYMARLWEASYKSEAKIFGPALAPVSKIRGRYRVRLLIKVQKKKNIQTSIRSWLKRIAIPRSVKMNIDVDPQNFY